MDIKVTGDGPRLYWPQFQTSFKLARAHGHLWAKRFNELLRGEEEVWKRLFDTSTELADQVRRFINKPAESLSSVDIASITRAACEPQWEEWERDGEILAPYFEEYGEDDIVHRTGTGRLDWRVFPWGGVLLQIYRPKDELVLDIEVPYNESGKHRYCHAAKYAPYYVRHVESLVWALEALGYELQPQTMAMAVDFEVKLALSKEGKYGEEWHVTNADMPKYAARLEAAKVWKENNR